MKMKIRALLLVLVASLLVMSMALVRGQDATVVRIMWYDDGNEGQVLRELLDAFEAANPDIRVIIDTVAYGDLHTILQAQVEAGDPPDMARITDVARFRGSYLDLRDLVEDASYWDANFPVPVMNSLRLGADDDGIYGFPTQFTVSGPFVNLTAFELAGVELPGPEASWDDWEAAIKEVQAITGIPYGFALDRTGHRFWTFSISQGAVYTEDGGMTFTVDTPGFRAAAERLMRYHTEGFMPPDVWGGASGGYVAANEYFVNGQVVMYVSGSWQVGQFANLIQDFDWTPVPNPTDVGGKCMMPGGAVLVAFNGTRHPEAVARVMDYLASQDVLEEFSAQSLFLPGHLTLAEQGIEFPSNNDALNVFLSEIPDICDQAYDLQYSPYTFILNPAIRDRLSQVAAGELTLDEAIEAIQRDVDEGIAAAQG